jgi:protein-S-isoprenylcysteine O-methyltransferase Ste14
VRRSLGLEDATSSADSSTGSIELMSWEDVVSAACWGIVIVVWIVGAIDTVRTAPKVESKPRPGVIPIALFIAVILVLTRIHWEALSFDPTWLAVIGAVVLVASTVFTIWSRVVLGSMWSVNALARVDHELRTSGPYSVTRHPIYTGLIGMVIGTALVSGQGEWILILILVVVGLVGKAVREERVMAATFPQEYAAYRGRVPGLIPRPWRHHTS